MTAGGPMTEAVLAWAAMVVFSGVNGFVRDLAVMPAVGERAGHTIAYLVVIVFVWAVAWVYAGRHPGLTGAGLIVVGLLWVALGAALEGTFILVSKDKGLGGVLRGMTAPRLVMAGVLWLTVLVSPLVCGLIRRAS